MERDQLYRQEERTLTETERGFLECFHRTFDNADGALVLDTLEKLHIGLDSPEMLSDLLADIPHPYRAYATMGIQRMVLWMRRQTLLGEEVQVLRTIRLSDPVVITEEEDTHE